MISILISLLVFVSTTGIHVLLHRWLMRKGIKTFLSVCIYGVGLLILGIYFRSNSLINQNPQADSLPLVASVIYILVSVLYILLFTSPYTGDIAPSTSILSLIKRSPGISLQSILKHFSNQELIHKRLLQLSNQGYIQKDHQTYTILPRGGKLMRIINAYRTVLNWKSSG